jgi:hypothetical protein
MRSLTGDNKFGEEDPTVVIAERAITNSDIS